MKSKTFVNVWVMALNPLKLIILVMCLAPAMVLADCGDEPLYPTTVTLDIEVNAL